MKNNFLGLLKTSDVICFYFVSFVFSDNTFLYFLCSLCLCMSMEKVPTCTYIQYVYKLTCFTVTPDWTSPDSWPGVEREKCHWCPQAMWSRSNKMCMLVFMCVCVCTMGPKCEEWFWWFIASWLRSKSSQTCVNEVSKEGNGEKTSLVVCGWLCVRVCVCLFVHRWTIWN